LTMTYEGARHQTADEMREVLYLPSDEVDWRSDELAIIKRLNTPHNAYELSTANALWLEATYPFKEDYLKTVEGTYFAEARNLDFIDDPETSRATINKWVLDKTQNRIDNLLPPGSIQNNTRLVLTNAVYFKGKWSVPFNKNATKQDVFWISPTASVPAAMMGLEGKSFGYLENDQEQIVALPYQGERLSMVVVLPRSKDIQSIENAINEPKLKDWNEAIVPQAVNVFIPKFKFDAKYQMKHTLVQMGMHSAFDHQLADFSGMANLKPEEHLYIDQVYHKAWIEVNEEGTEAAAATAVVMMTGMAMMVQPVQPKVFRADHPFIFLILDNKTGQILFMGRVSDPRK